jgi:hypothetical protein
MDDHHFNYITKLKKKHPDPKRKGGQDIMRFVQNGLTKFKAQVYGLLHIGMVIISFQEILALEWCLLLSKLSTLYATT